MKVVITDLDGTLLDHDSYSWSEAAPAVEALRTAGIPLVLCSSKTRAEMEELRRELNNKDPFIVENGGALFVPRDYFPFAPWFSRPVDQYDAVLLGAEHPQLVTALKESAEAAGCEVRGFSDMSDEEVAAASRLDADDEE